MICIGQQKKVTPRTLFRHKLFCRGCGRCISEEDEEFQKIPADCCRLKSLELKSEIRCKEAGVQAGGFRKDATTYMLGPDVCDAGVATQTDCLRVASSTNFSTAIECSKNSSSILRVSIMDPDGGFEESTHAVAQSCWTQCILDMECVTNPEHVIFYAQEVVYARRSGRYRAMQCFDDANRRIHLVDFEKDAMPRSSSWELFTRRFFRHDEPLPDVPRFMLRIFMLTDTQVLIINHEGQLEEVSKCALDDPCYLASLTGIRSQQDFFWELVGDSFVNASSGEVFWRRGWIPKSDGNKRHVLLLLRDGDPVPKANLLRNKVLRVFRRAGVQLTIKDGLLQSLGTPPTDMHRWESPIKVESFEKDFTSVARIKK